jgi:hypothetical protein
MLAESLVSVGCDGGVGSGQKLNAGFDNGPDLAVFHRSVPFGGAWPDIVGLIDDMKTAGYTVVPLVILRDHDCTVKSQMRNNHVIHESQAKRHIRMALGHIFDSLVVLNIVPAVIVYELFVEKAGYRDIVFRSFGLTPPKMEYYNANLKY